MHSKASKSLACVSEKTIQVTRVGMRLRQRPTRTQEGPQPGPVGAGKGSPTTQGRTPWRRKGPQGQSPCGPLSAHIEKRPPRARRPALPQPRAAVLSAKAGLTAGFGMGPGDPRLCGRARGGRSPAAHVFEPARVPFRGDPGGRAAKEAESSRRLAKSLTRMRRARAISSARLSGSPRLHLRPVDRVVYPGPYRKVDSSRRRLPA